MNVHTISQEYQNAFPQIISFKEFCKSKQYAPKYKQVVLENEATSTVLRLFTESFIPKLEKLGYVKLGTGACRVGMLSPDGDTVLKLPLHLDGVMDNYRERKLYLDTLGKCDNFAECHLEGLFLVMKRCVKLHNVANRTFTAEQLAPNQEWLDIVDSEQCGVTADSDKLVAYDYGDLTLTVAADGNEYIHKVYNTWGEVKVNGYRHMKL